MVQRCTNPNLRAWKNYGGRGITVCDRWKKFPAFLADMGECPPGLTLDRIDTDKGTNLRTAGGLTGPHRLETSGSGVPDTSAEGRI